MIVYQIVVYIHTVLHHIKRFLTGMLASDVLLRYISACIHNLQIVFSAVACVCVCVCVCLSIGIGSTLMVVGPFTGPDDV